jgi:hypothetical protein
MGGVLPETCWALYKYGIIKFWYIVASCWMYEYIGVLLGAHPILHISRIKINKTWI